MGWPEPYIYAVYTFLVFGLEITKYLYGHVWCAYIRFWPTYTNYITLNLIPHTAATEARIRASSDHKPRVFQGSFQYAL
jgi:hypothetical protein